VSFLQNHGLDCGPPSTFKVHASPIPTMLWDHRSHDLDGASELTAQIYPFQSCISDLTSFKSTTVICFRIPDFRILKSQTFLSSIRQSSRSRRFVDTCPSQSTALPLLQGFDLSTRSTVLWPFSRSTVEISFGSPDF
jgi:hypothetical protein